MKKKVVKEKVGNARNFTRIEFIVTGILTLLIVLLLIWVYSLRRKSDRCENSLVKTKTEMLEMQKSLDDCKNSRQNLLSKIDSLESLIAEQKDVKPVVRTKIQQKPMEATVILNVKVREEAGSVVSVAKAPEVVKKDLIVTQAPQTRSVMNYSLPSYYYNERGEIIFCIRLGGSENRHLPHLAIYDGIIAQDNNLSGFNWVVIPTKTMTGDVGILESDGTFYVACKLIDKYLNDSDKGIIEIKAPATNWEPKQVMKSGNYYIYKK